MRCTKLQYGTARNFLLLEANAFDLFDEIVTTVFAG